MKIPKTLNIRWAIFKIIAPFIEELLEKKVEKLNKKADEALEDKGA